MKNMGKIQGSKEQAKELIVGLDTVYVHTNIVKLEEDNQGNKVDNLYEYDEVQYTKDEFIEMQSEQITNLQLAMLEILEGGM